MNSILFEVEDKESVPDVIKSLPVDSCEEDIVTQERVQQYKEATSSLHNVGEDSHTLADYKNAVKALLIPNLKGQ